MNAITNQYNPDYAIHPGEYLEEILESREIKKRDFAARVGLTTKAVSQIINRKSLFSPDVALMFEKTLGVNAEIWMNLIDAYQLREAREKEKKRLETQKTADWVKNFPIAELKRLGHIPNSRKPEVIADALLRFFNVSSPETWKEYQLQRIVSYRKSMKFRESAEATAVWLNLAEKQAETIETAGFDKTVFKARLDDIRELTVQAPNVFYPQILKICNSTGVALVLVPELRNTHISGASFWATPQKPVIAVSLRYKTNDHFWFTFFHEAAHLLFHSKKNVYIDIKEDGHSDEEKEADQFASNILIPEPEYRQFIELDQFYKNHIQTFAKKIGIHPGIVAGRLQHDGKIKHEWYNDLKERYIIVEEEA